MLNDYGIKEYWTKLYSIESCSKNEDFLLMFDTIGQVCMYDLGTCEMMKLPVHWYGSQAVMYAESLVSIESCNGAADSMNSKVPSMAGDMVGDCDYMHLDMVFHILLWLPVASLLRFKSVNKSWKDLIESSDFVHQHLNFTSRSTKCINRLIFLRWTNEYDSDSNDDGDAQLTLLSVANNSEIFVDFKNFDYPPLYGSMETVACCNGIICLRLGLRVCLWNPATQQLTFPPLPEVAIYQFLIGFGFDVKTNDYKLVFINRMLRTLKVSTRVYSLNSDSWRSIEGWRLTDVIITSKIDLNAPYRKGMYCWLARDHWDTSRQLIVSFDFSNEVFRKIPLPDIQNLSLFPLWFFFIRENIAGIYQVGDNPIAELVERRRYEIWMLEDYDDQQSWTRLYKVEQFRPDFAWVTWVFESRDFLLVQHGKYLYLYDLVRQRRSRVPVAVQGVEAVVYEESLVSVQRGNSGAAAHINKTSDGVLKVSIW